MNLARTLATGLAVGSLVTLTACGGGTAAGDDVPEPVASIDVGVAPDFFFSHLYLAVQEGFFAAEGIDATITEFPSGGEATAAITAGQSDITSTTASTISTLAGRGGDVTALASNLVGDGWFAIVSNGQAGEIGSAADLEGLSVAAQAGSVLDMHVRTFLLDHGADTDVIDYRDVTSAQLVTGLSRGDYDAASMWEPNVSRALTNIEGSSVVLDSDETMPVTGYTVAGAGITSDPDIVHRVLTALQNTIVWMDENPAEVLELVMGNSAIDDEELAQTIQDKITYRLDFSEEDVAAIHEAGAFYREQGLIEATEEDLEAMYDVSFYESWLASRD